MVFFFFYSTDGDFIYLFFLISLLIIYSFIYFTLQYFTLQYCIGFALHQHESATGVHMFPILNPPSTSLPRLLYCFIPIPKVMHSRYNLGIKNKKTKNHP